MKISMTNCIKSYSCFIIFISALLFPGVSLYSETFFMKDGSITEGNITSEDDNKISIKRGTGEAAVIERKNILRVLVHKRYLDKKYITKNGGIVLYGYIVNEDNDNYIFRQVLESSVEIKIPRDEVETISTKPASERLTQPSTYSSVFTRDGKIIDCKIIKESIKSIELQSNGGEITVIPIIDILRIQYNNSYKDKKILGKIDGTRIEAYIMEENLDSYIYRSELNSPEEFKIYKYELKSISKK